MYHMARGYDESSRLVHSEQPVPSSSAPNLTVDPPPVQIRPSTYGSIGNASISTSDETEPLLDEDLRPIDPKV